MRQLYFGMIVTLLAVSICFGATYTYDTKADWDDLYEIGAEGAWGHPNTRDEVNLNYHRFVLIDADRKFANRLATLLGWSNTTALMIYHCGFCWIAEILQDENGLQRVVGVQQSTYIQNAKGTNEDADLITAIEKPGVGLSVSEGDGLTLFNIMRNSGLTRSKRPNDVLDESLDTTTSRNNLKNLLGANYEVLTYQILSSLNDSEVIALGNRLSRATRGRITHLVFTGTDVAICSPTPCFTARSLDRLKTLLPDQGFVDLGTFEYRP